MSLHQNSYGTFGSGPVDRDQERLVHELFVERNGDLLLEPTTSTPHRTAITFLAARVARLRSAIAHPTA